MSDQLRDGAAADAHTQGAAQSRHLEASAGLEASASPVDVAAADEFPPSPKSKDVHRFMDLVRYAYGRDGQRVSATAIPRDITSRLDLDDADRAEIKARGRRDVFLRVPWQLLAAVLRGNPQPGLIDRTIEVAVDAALVHPVLNQEASLQAPRASEVPSQGGDGLADLRRGLRACRYGGPISDHVVEASVAAAAALSLERVIEVLESLPSVDKVPPREADSFQQNLMNLMVLLFALRGTWPLQQVAEVLEKHLWGPRRAASTEPALLTVTDQPDPQPLAELSEIWRSRVATAELGAAEARLDVQRVSRHVSRLQERLDQLEAERVELNATIEALLERSKSLEDEVAERDRRLGDTRAHASHDYETLRTASIQRARRELELLQEGLHAVSRDEPKVHVTRDRLERAIEGLERELQDLKGGVPG